MKGLTKQVYLVRGDTKESYTSFFDRIHEEAMLLLADKLLTGVSYTITEAAPPKISVIPFQKKKVALITVRKKGEEHLGQLLKLPGFDGDYAVTEALPVVYDKTWPEGEKTPGVCLLTLFKMKQGIDRQTFLNRWHNSHTPLSLNTDFHD